MEFKNIKEILKNDDKTLMLEWCDKYLKKLVSQSMGVHFYEPPFVAERSEKIEEYEYTWQSGYKAMVKRLFVNVYQILENEKVLIGEYEISNSKGVTLEGTFQPIFRNGKWFALISPGSGAKIYSLPDMTLLASTDKAQDSARVNDIYCPRFLNYLHVFDAGTQKEWVCHHSIVDDDIETSNRSEPWESAPFAFMSIYDPYSSSPTWVTMLDLRDIESGKLGYYDFCIEIPEWLSLRQAIKIDDWNKDWPTFDVALSESYSTVTGTCCGDCGWSSEQMDYFNWSGEAQHHRTESKKLRNKQKESSNESVD